MLAGPRTGEIGATDVVEDPHPTKPTSASPKRKIPRALVSITAIAFRFTENNVKSFNGFSSARLPSILVLSTQYEGRG